MKKLLLGLIVWFFSVSAFADSFDININNESARLSYVTGSDRTAETEYSFLFNEDDYKLPHLGLHIIDATGNQSQPLKMSLGGRFYALFNDPIKVFAIGLGGALIYTPGVAYGRLRFKVGAHFAPAVITFKDANRFVEYAAAVEYQILTRGFVYVGYRQIEVDFVNGGKVDIDEGSHIGLKILF